jgi:hypothetical protein
MACAQRKVAKGATQTGAARNYGNTGKLHCVTEGASLHLFDLESFVFSAAAELLWGELRSPFGAMLLMG